LGGGLVLEVGAEPADFALGFFVRAFGVERDEAFEDGFVKRGRAGARRSQGEVAPAVGGKDGAVQIVVELFEYRYQPLLVDDLADEWPVPCRLSRRKPILTRNHDYIHACRHTATCDCIRDGTVSKDGPPLFISFKTTNCPGSRAITNAP